MRYHYLNTMTKTETVRARIEPTLKKNVEKILKKLGMSTTDAITIFFRQITLHRGLPFSVNIPNKETLETFAKTDRGEELNKYEIIDELFKRLDELNEGNPDDKSI
jgi:DNA-damage-inducible protein J